MGLNKGFPYKGVNKVVLPNGKKLLLTQNRMKTYLIVEEYKKQGYTITESILHTANELGKTIQSIRKTYQEVLNFKEVLDKNQPDNGGNDTITKDTIIQPSEEVESMTTLDKAEVHDLFNAITLVQKDKENKSQNTTQDSITNKNKNMLKDITLKMSVIAEERDFYKKAYVELVEELKHLNKLLTGTNNSYIRGRDKR